MKHIIKAVFKVGLEILYCYFSFMNKYSKHPEKTPLDVRFKKVKKLILDALKALKVNTIVLGKENIPEVPSCFFSNHLSTGDTLIAFEALEKPFAFIGKKEVRKMPFVGKMFASADGLFLDRGNLKQELRVFMEVQKRLENKTESIFVYPEGTRNRDPLMNLMEFHPGTFRSAMKAKAPIVPVACYGAFRILSTTYDQSRYPAIIKFLKPIYPEEYENMSTEEIAQRVQSEIQKELTFNLRALDHKNMIEVNDKNYRFNTIY